MLQTTPTTTTQSSTFQPIWVSYYSSSSSSFSSSSSSSSSSLKESDLSKSREFIGCPSNSTYFGHTNMCYMFHGSGEEWTQARKSCQLKGGELASILDKETNNFLRKVAKIVTWIGGYRLQNADSWHWSDGSIWDWENWQKGKQNNFNGNQEHVSMNDNTGNTGKWGDLANNENRPYLCQIPKSANSFSATTKSTTMLGTPATPTTATRIKPFLDRTTTATTTVTTF